MNKTILLIFFLGILFLGFSCQYQVKRVEPILQKAESILEQNPDSALAMLKEIPNPQSLKKSLYYRYFLIQIQAKDKSYRDITSDTLIFNIQKNYEKKDDLEKTALVSYYSGRVRQEQGKHEEALETYLGAEKYLIQSNNDKLKGLVQSAIGAIYYEQLLADKAIIHFKKAEKLFRSAKNYRNEAITGNLIGDCFLMEGKADSAFIYYDKALALVDKNELKQEQVGIRESIGLALLTMEDWADAEKFLKETLYLTTDSIEKSRVLSNLAGLFLQMGKIDSASHYIMQSLAFLPAEKDNYLAANIYETWSAIDEKSDNFQEALKKYKSYSDYLVLIFDENRNQAVIEIEKKYNYQLLENRNHELLIGRQRMLIYFLGVLLLCVLFILWILRRAEMRRKELKEAERKIVQMQKMAGRYNENENSYRNIVSRHFEILKKTALLKGYLNEDEKKKGKHFLRKFNEVVYGEKDLNWDLLYEALDNAGNGIFKQLRNRLTQLDDSEFRICCLIYVGCNNTEVGLILDYSTNTIRAKKNAIRKKLGVGPYGNLSDFMKDVL